MLSENLNLMSISQHCFSINVNKQKFDYNNKSYETCLRETGSFRLVVAVAVVDVVKHFTSLFVADAKENVEILTTYKLY